MDLGPCGDWWNDTIGSWWAEQTWGSVPDWFAAVGTVGALFLGLIILTNERKRNRRADADSFATWWVASYEGSSVPGSETSGELIVYALNSGSLPIQGASLLGIDPDSYEPLHELMKETGGEEMETIDPGERIKYVLTFDRAPDVNKFYVRFADGRGHLWHRQLKGNKYVSRKKAFADQE